VKKLAWFLQKHSTGAYLVLVVAAFVSCVIVVYRTWRMVQRPPERMVLEVYLPPQVAVEFSEASLPGWVVTEQGPTRFTEAESLTELASVAAEVGVRNTLRIARGGLLYQTELAGRVCYYRTEEPALFRHEMWAVISRGWLVAGHLPRFEDGKLVIFWAYDPGKSGAFDILLLPLILSGMAGAVAVVLLAISKAMLAARFPLPEADSDTDGG